jgi:hypothetical protein
LEDALYDGVCEIIMMILFLTRKDFEIPTGNTHGYILDPYVVLTITCGGTELSSFWVRPLGDGLSGFDEPI